MKIKKCGLINALKPSLCLLHAVVILCAMFPISALADEESSSNIFTINDLSGYQVVIDRLNEEYGYSMYFDPELFTGKSNYKHPLGSTLAEFESTLRKDIEDDIRVNNESKKAIAALGDVEWKSLPSKDRPNETDYSNISIYNHIEPNEICENFEVKNKNFDNSKPLVFYAPEINATANASSNKMLTSVQARLDPTGNSAFTLFTIIYIENYWRYESVYDYGYTRASYNEYPCYRPIDMSYSYMDGRRTVDVIFTCERYNGNGVIINNSSIVAREFYASSDCITNVPNYTIYKTYTNQDYRHFGINNSLNCAGYAWNYNAFVGEYALNISNAELNNCSNLNELRTLVKNKSQSYMSSHGINATVISSYNSTINPSTQYRAVMRVGYYDTNGNGTWDLGVNLGGDEWDFHWMLQLGDGSWADKRGNSPTRIVPNSNLYSNDPCHSNWTLYNGYGEVLHYGFYNSTPVYYKITP